MIDFSLGDLIAASHDGELPINIFFERVAWDSEDDMRRRRERDLLEEMPKKINGGCLGLYFYSFQCSEWLDCQILEKIWVKKEGEEGKGKFKFYEVVFPGKDSGGLKIL